MKKLLLFTALVSSCTVGVITGNIFNEIQHKEFEQAYAQHAHEALEQVNALATLLTAKKTLQDSFDLIVGFKQELLNVLLKSTKDTLLGSTKDTLIGSTKDTLIDVDTKLTVDMKDFKTLVDTLENIITYLTKNLQAFDNLINQKKLEQKH